MIDKETSDKLLLMQLGDAANYIERLENQQGCLLYVPIPPHYDPQNDIPFDDADIEQVT